MEDKKEFLYDFFQKRELCCIATVTADGKPECAYMQFGALADLSLVFGTPRTSRKFANLQTNHHIALAIGWEEYATVQYEGTVTELTAEELQVYKEALFTKTPGAKKWESSPDMVYFKVMPSWLRYIDLNEKPWELTF